MTLMQIIIQKRNKLCNEKCLLYIYHNVSQLPVSNSNNLTLMSGGYLEFLL